MPLYAQDTPGIAKMHTYQPARRCRNVNRWTLAVDCTAGRSRPAVARRAHYRIDSVFQGTEGSHNRRPLHRPCWIYRRRIHRISRTDVQVELAFIACIAIDQQEVRLAGYKRCCQYTCLISITALTRCTGNRRCRTVGIQGQFEAVALLAIGGHGADNYTVGPGGESEPLIVVWNTAKTRSGAGSKTGCFTGIALQPAVQASIGAGISARVVEGGA